MDGDRSTPSGHGLDRGQLLAVLEASRTVNEAIEPAEACRLVAENAAAVLEAEEASLLLLDPSSRELVFRAVVDPASSSVMEGRRIPADEGIAGQVVRTSRPLRIEDVRQNRHFYPGIDKVTHTRTRDLMAAPLIHHGAVIGVIEVINRRGPAPFTARDLELLEVFANLVAGTARHLQTVEKLQRENRGLRESLPAPHFVGRSDPFCNALALCRKVAGSSTTVLLTGETGTGKEMAARTIWALSPRADQPFVAVNCAALPESLLESELFGHEAGAFTGATSARPGRFELAHHGTLLLDEIGELELALQAKLLRVLESGELTRVGGARPLAVDVRVIAASNRNLKGEVEAGRFRDDLYFRLSAFPIELPPLRGRPEDLPLLVEDLLARIAPSLNTVSPEISAAAWRSLKQYPWPGNVRELRNVIERAVLLSEGEIRPEHLPPEVAAGKEEGAPDADGVEPDRSVLADQELRLVREALERNDWNQSAAARDLGVSRDILRYRMKRYGLGRR